MTSPSQRPDPTSPATSAATYLPPQDPALTRENFTRLFQDIVAIGNLVWQRTGELHGPAINPIAFHRYCLNFTERLEKVCRTVHLYPARPQIQNLWPSGVYIVGLLVPLKNYAPLIVHPNLLRPCENRDFTVHR